MKSIIDDKIEKASSLLKRKGISKYEIYASSGDMIRAESEQGEMKNLERASENGLSIRIMHEGSMGFAYGSEADERLIDAAYESAKYQFSDEYNTIPEKQGDYKCTDIFDYEILKISAEICIEKARQLESAARDFDMRVRQTRKASFARAASNVRIVNSTGIDISARATYCTASIMVMAGSGEEMQSGYDFGASHFIEDVDVDSIGKRASKNAISLLGARHINTCSMPVLFDSTTAAEIIEAISGSFIGENVMKGKSILKDKIDRVFFSECITLSDNPLHKKSTDGFPFDGEGIASRENLLIEKGRVVSFVYDSYWGKKSGRTSTGNSIRGSYRSVPTLGLRHLCLELGASMDGLLSGIGKVLKVTDIMGMHTVDPISGEFSVGINGILLHNGLEEYPVREAAIAGNIFTMLGNVLHVGDDMRSFGNVQTPSILIDNMDVSSK